LFLQRQNSNSIIVISIYQQNHKNNSFLVSFVKSAIFLQTKLQKDGAFHWLFRDKEPPALLVRGKAYSNKNPPMIG
jgi:hypothetical protein